MRPRFRYPIVGALLVGALALSGMAAYGRSQPALRLFDLTTARGIAGGKACQPTRVFAPDDEVIYLWYAADGCTIGTTIRSTWLYLETDPPFRIAEGDVTVTRSDNWGQFNFKLAEGRRWAIGRYRIELRVGDDLMAETDFWVSAVQTAGIPAASTEEEGRVWTCRETESARRSRQ